MVTNQQAVGAYIACLINAILITFTFGVSIYSLFVMTIHRYLVVRGHVHTVSRVSENVGHSGNERF